MPQEFEQFTYSRIPGEKKEGERPHGYAWIYDGHGAQYVGMGLELAKTYPAIKGMYQLGDRVVGYSLSKICFFGPEDSLLQTKFAQPGIVLTSEACTRVLLEDAYEEDEGRFSNSPRLVAGESLGMVNALHRAGAFGKWGSQEAFVGMMRFAAYRGSVFQRVAEQNPSSLFMVSGTKGCSQEDYDEIIQELGKRYNMKPALIKAKNEYVVGGKVEHFPRMTEFLTDLPDFVRFQRIPTATGAFHTDEMRGAVPYIEEYFENFPLQDTSIPVLLNTGDDIRTTTNARELEADCIRGVTEVVQGPEMVSYIERENIAGHYIIGEKGLFARTLKNNSDISVLDKIKSKKGLIVAGGTALGVAGAVGVGIFVQRKRSDDKDSKNQSS